jgi:hypothetical protein
MYNGKIYRSSREAALKENRSRSQILRDLRDQTKTEIYYLEKEKIKWGEIPIFGQKGDSPSVLFDSYVEAGFATNKQNARRKIQRNETGWRYAHVDSNGKPLRTPYTLKEGEISYKERHNQQIK